jgi:hypothetical protein
MPNWCTNVITVSGSLEKISQIKDLIESIENKEEANLFQTLVGIPKHINKEDFIEKLYDINISFWGTKSDVSYNDAYPQFIDHTILLCPDTAWSPPVGFGLQLAKVYLVNVEMFYAEPGENFCGKTKCDKDGIISVEDYDYQKGLYIFDKDLFWSEIESEAEYLIFEAEKTLDEFIEVFHYVDKEEITTFYNEFK